MFSCIYFTYNYLFLINLLTDYTKLVLNNMIVCCVFVYSNMCIKSPLVHILNVLFLQFDDLLTSRGLTGGFLLLQNFSVAISVSPHVRFILVLILISMFLR